MNDIYVPTTIATTNDPASPFAAYVAGLNGLPAVTFDLTWPPAYTIRLTHSDRCRCLAIGRLRSTVAERRRRRWNRKRRSR